MVALLGEAGHECTVVARSAFALSPPHAVILCHDIATLKFDGTVDGIVHLAGMVSHSKDGALVETMRRTNVEGTEVMVELAAKLGVPIAIASTSGVAACSWVPRVGEAADNYCDATVQDFPYYQSKIDAERLAFTIAEARGVALTAVRFPMLLGPGERTPLRSLRVVSGLLRGSFPMLTGGGMSMVDVRDVAAQFAALVEMWGRDHKGPSTTRTVQLCGQNCTFREFADELRAVRPYAPPAYTVPPWLLRRVADVMEVLGVSFGSVTPMNLRMGSMFWWCRSSASAVPTRPMQATLRDTAQYLETLGTHAP